MFKIIASPQPYKLPLGIPIAVNLEDEAKVETDPAKLISDESRSDTHSVLTRILIFFHHDWCEKNSL